MLPILSLMLFLAPLGPAADLNLKTVDPTGAGMDRERLSRIPSVMRKFVEDGKAAGIVTLVVRHGRVAEFSATGFQDLDKKTPMRTDSIFRIASMTKPVSSVAVIMLMEQGKLALIDPVEKYLPEFRSQKQKATCPPGSTESSCLIKPPHAVTLWDLLTHTSGVGGPKEATKPRTLAERILGIAQLPLEFEPGTQWRYRTEGIDILGRIVEVVSGMPFDRFVQENIFTPVGMVDSSFFPLTEKLDRMATMYTESGGKLGQAADSRDTLYPSPGGGMLSTAADMARFYQMMLNKGVFNGRKIISSDSVALMTMNHVGNLQAGFAAGMGFGLGWGVVRDPKGAFRLCSVGSYGHGGAFRTYGWVDPPKDMVRVIMLQRTNGGGDVADEINAFLAMAAAAINQ